MADIKRVIDIAAKVPVLLRDSTGTPITGVVFGDVTAKFRKFGETSLTSKTVTGSNWFEVGDGWYDLLFTAGDLGTLKDFNYIAIESGSVQWNGFAEVIPEEENDIKAKTDAIKAKTDNLPADPASDTNVDAVQAALDSGVILKVSK